MVFTFCFTMAAFGKNLSFYSITDVGYNFGSDFVSGGTHFAPVKKIYDGIELSETLKGIYTIPVPFGESQLVKDNKIELTGAISLTPVSIMPRASISFTPVAFLNFSAGADIGTAWKVLGIKSISCHDPSTNEYKMQRPFETWYYNAWLNATLMADLAFIWPGDFHHVILAASMEVNYSGLLNSKDDDEIFQWQTTSGKTRGAGYNSTFIIGYQLPYKLNLVGLKLNKSGYFKKSLSAQYENFNIDFSYTSLGAFCSYNFSEKDSLFALVEFQTRRSFTEFHDDPEKEPLMNYSGHEWIFKRIGFSYSHKF
ncbi:MAG: hypothetical protein KBT11_03035 [Treponema sp.]|nr:hypothetical protein [Candidatus Treponema equifaecale]